jgi:GT2 family glycosyltransferase
MPATLHITHSWGGGVARWIESFIEADTDGVNFQLRSEGPEKGQGTGQRLALYYGNQTVSPVASWWLQPPIRSTAGENDQYRRILEEISRRYGIGRIIVSSLVGHSLDAFTSGLPTLQVLHDFYPCWPLLGVHPETYLEGDSAAGLETAMEENRMLPELADRDAASWKRLGRAWRETVVENRVELVAPSRSVAELFTKLDPDLSGQDIEIIPHGLPPWPGQTRIEARDREDGKLRLVIPGRMQEGKGQYLLLEALPELTRLAQVYLLGCGKQGEEFFGRSGVDVILQYERQELPELLAKIGPHAAALLSVVPETFSYTLSEMQSLGIPVIATRVGSLVERISDGETGWLIEPRAESLLQRVLSISEDRNSLEKLRSCLAGARHADSAEMVARYARRCAPQTARANIFTIPGLETLQTASVESEQVLSKTKNRQLSRKAEALEHDLEQRTQWAEERDLALRSEQEQRIKWVNKLEGQLEERFEELQAARDDFEQAQEALEHEQAALRREQLALKNTQAALLNEQTIHKHTQDAYDQLKSQHEWVLSSSSWRITKPLRVARRMLDNFINARGFNPLRWPLLLSQLVRTLKTHGLKGALMRSQVSSSRGFVPEPLKPEQIEQVGDPDPPMKLPVSGQPVVSIVIPVHNQWSYTAACLRSLVETGAQAAFEVIVVDDQSSDDTAERLDSIEGIVSMRNEENLGFVGSCNRGAEEAKGEYLVLLNNDTQVLEGWLDALLDTFAKFPDTGLAGARLVYADGSLQEAGGIVFRDGSGWNYGRGDNPDRPEYSYSREVDYCSGACIMVPTKLFRKLGGLDKRYAPAYYEDTDLAFAVRSLGLKVRLQAASTIIHHEGISSGTDPEAGIKRYQGINREKFLERWQDELSACPEPISDPSDASAIRRARDHRLRGRILVIDAYTPEPDQDSGSLRLKYLLQCFVELGYGVTFFADNRSHAGRYTRDLQQAGIEVVYNPWLESLGSFFGKRGSEFDFVWISRHYVAANYISLIRRYCPGAKFIFDTVDLHYLREERLAELENSLPLKRSARQTRRSELSVIEAADATLVVSPIEKSVLEQDAPDASVHVISNVHKIAGSRKPFAERKDIFFVGGYQHPPNIDAAKWFVSRIWPLIREELPDVTFHLIGSKAPEQVRNLHGDGVVFHGFVKSLEPWLDGCRLALAPLRYGAGVKGKVNISMSRGQPVVATPAAVEGLFARPGEDILVAESAREFASAVVRLYQDEELWNRISAGGLENVRAYFSIDTARRSLQALLESLT